MRTFAAIILLAIGLQTSAQNQIEEKTIQNFYTTCRESKFTAINYKNLGIQYSYQGKYEKSIEHFKTSLERDETLCDSWYLIGYSYQQLGDYEKSIESCDRSLELNSWSISAYIIKGYSNLYLNNTIEAIENFEKAKEIDPGKIDAYYGIALVKYYEQDYDSARNEINEYLSSNTDRVSRKDYKALSSLGEKLEMMD